MDIIGLPGLSSIRGYPNTNICVSDPRKAIAYSCGNRIYVVPDSYFTQTENKAEIIVVPYHNSRVSSLLFHPKNDSHLLSGDDSGRFLITSPFHPDLLTIMDRQAIGSTIESIAVDIDGNNCIVVGRSGSSNGTNAAAFSLVTEAPVGDIMGHGESIMSCSIRPHRPYFAVTGGEDGQVILHKSSKYGFLTICPNENSKRINCVQYHPSGRYFAVAGLEKSITFYSGMIQKELVYSSGSTPRPVPLAFKVKDAHSMGISSLQFVQYCSQDYLVSVSSDRTLKIWKIHDVVEAPESNETYPVVTGLKADLVSVVDFSKKASKFEMMLTSVKCLKQGSDGCGPILFVSSFNGTIFRIPFVSIIDKENYDINEITEVKTIIGPVTNVIVAAYSAKNKTICSCSSTAAHIYHTDLIEKNNWDSSYVLPIDKNESALEAAPKSQVIALSSYEDSFYGICKNSFFIIKKIQTDSGERYEFSKPEETAEMLKNKTNGKLKFCTDDDDNQDEDEPEETTAYKVINERFVKAIYHKENNSFVITSQSSRIYVWNIINKEITLVADFSECINPAGKSLVSLQMADIAFDKSLIAVAIAPEIQGKRTTLYVLPLETATKNLTEAYKTGKYSTNFPSINCLIFSSDNTKLAVAGSDKRICVYSFDDFENSDSDSGINVVPTIGRGMDLHNGVIIDLNWINNDTIISRANDGGIFVWSANTEGKVATIVKKFQKIQTKIASAAISIDSAIDLEENNEEKVPFIIMTESGIAKFVNDVKVKW